MRRIVAAAVAIWLAGWTPAVAQCVSEASPYGINAHAPQGTGADRLLDEVQACGLGWIRIDFVWAWAEPAQDSFNWSIYDQLAAKARSRGLHIFATISHTPAWATNGVEGTGVPRNAADFYDICFRAADRYRDSIRHWGMWNEPNLSQFWAGTRSQYIELILKNGADAVHAASPGAKVCGPELAHLSSGSWDTWLTDCINQAGDRLDVLTHHAYGDNATRVTERLEKARVWPWDPPSVKQVLQSTGWYGRPFWLTEVGWESAEVGESAQASHYTNLLNTWLTGQANRTWVDKIFFYELNDTQAFSTITFGILGQDPLFPRKPAFTAYQSFITAWPPPPGAPDAPTTPSPADGTEIENRAILLQWSPARCAASYDVYFGTNSPGTLRGHTSSTAFDPGPLAWYTTYYWRVDAVNGSVVTTGPVWSFTTAAPADFDRDGDVDQSDFAVMQRCLAGNGQPVSSDCSRCDLDRDGDVDGVDVNAFQDCTAGPDAPPRC